jgi:hypothetical protein
MSFHSSLPFAAIAATLLSTSSFGALIAGDVAIVGFQASGVTTDSVSFVTFVDLAPGTVLYFTDNGWTGTAFRGVSATDGDGNENLMRFTVVNTIVAGTIIGSRTSSADYAWALSGLVGPGTSAYASFRFPRQVSKSRFSRAQIHQTQFSVASLRCTTSTIRVHMKLQHLPQLEVWPLDWFKEPAQCF